MDPGCCSGRAGGVPRAIGEPGCAPGPCTVVAADSPGHTEPVTMAAGLQCPQISNPARWMWPSRRTARRPWNAWPRGCPLPVSQSCPSALQSRGVSVGQGGRASLLTAQLSASRRHHLVQGARAALGRGWADPLQGWEAPADPACPGLRCRQISLRGLQRGRGG